MANKAIEQHVICMQSSGEKMRHLADILRGMAGQRCGFDAAAS